MAIVQLQRWWSAEFVQLGSYNHLYGAKFTIYGFLCSFVQCDAVSKHNDSCFSFDSYKDLE